MWRWYFDESTLRRRRREKKKLQCENTKRVTVFRCRRKNWMKLILFRLWSEPNGYDVTTAPHKLTHSVCALRSTDEMSISVCCFWSSELCIVCEYKRRRKKTLATNASVAVVQVCIMCSCIRTFVCLVYRTHVLVCVCDVDDDVVVVVVIEWITFGCLCCDQCSSAR